MNNQVDRELGWDDEIVDDGPVNILLPEGDYNFTVINYKRTRHPGSANLPPCNKAELEITIHCPENGDVTVYHNLFLHTKTEGFLSNFFTGIGKKEPGERIRMNWDAVVGAKGRCQLEHNRYTSNGEERVNNQIKTFYPYNKYLEHMAQNQPAQNQTQPFPMGNQQQGQQQQQQTNTGFTQGQF